jgi:hypothetical protein
MSRMVGGTFGVAVLGALITGLGKRGLGELLPALPASARDKLGESLGAGGGAHGVTPQVADAMRESFVYALQHRLQLGAAVAATGAGLAWWLVAPLSKAEPAAVQDELAEAA